MSINLEKDNSHENEEEQEGQTLGEFLMEPIIQIFDDYDPTQEKTDEEISLHSLEKKSKNTPPTRAPSSVWQHYEKIFDDKGDCINIKCNYCDQRYSSKSSTSTLNDHWKKKHSKVQPGGVGSIEAAFNNKSQPTREKEYPEIVDNLVNWVIADCQPFRVVDGLYFKEFITGLNPRFKIPSRQTLRKKIDNKYEQYKKDIIKMLQVNLF